MSKRDKKKANPANQIKTGSDVLKLVRKNMHRNQTVSLRPGGSHQWVVGGKDADGNFVGFPVSDHPQPMKKGTLRSTIKKLIALGLLVAGIILVATALSSGVDFVILSVL